MQLMPKGIRVNAVAPGPVYTPLQPASRSGDQMEGWGVGEEILHSRVAQPAELGERLCLNTCPILKLGSQLLRTSSLPVQTVMR